MIVKLEAGVTLKECAFCGSNAQMKSQPTPYIKESGTHYWVKCSNIKCGASPLSQPSQAEAIKIWNDRT